MLLGDMLATLRDETAATETLMALGDLTLMVALDAAAHRAGETTASYAVQAVQQFADQADDEAWLDLLGVLRYAEDPAAACLGRMLAWSLRRDGALLSGARHSSGALLVDHTHDECATGVAHI